MDKILGYIVGFFIIMGLIIWIGPAILAGLFFVFAAISSIFETDDTLTYIIFGALIILGIFRLMFRIKK
ncbi:MAG: hypothetical protein LBE36_06280 [Flavobacteriaceae bacterium]|jgi:hypothetical protein|nr:hypothetical protein [Flavobacteriaceae bacterium]